MANLTKAQIDELKEKGLITQVVPSDDLASKTVDGLKNEKYVTVTDPSADIEAAVTHEIPVDSITLNYDHIELFIDWPGQDKKQLTATVLPVDATDPSVSWSSSNTTIATVDNTGLVSSHSLIGECVITATAGDKSAQCSVYVALPE